MIRKTVAFLLWLLTLLPVGVFHLNHLALLVVDFNHEAVYNRAGYIVSLSAVIAGLLANYFGYRMKRKDFAWFLIWIAIGFFLLVSRIPNQGWPEFIIMPAIHFGLILVNCTAWQLFKRLPGNYPILDEGVTC